MTVIAAIVDKLDGTVYMAADGAGERNGMRVPKKKIRRLKTQTGDEFLFGCAGDGDLKEVMRQITVDESPDPSDEDSCDQWAQALAAAWTREVDEMPLAPIETYEGRTVLSGAGILGYGGRIWLMMTNLAIPAVQGFQAVGSGADFAVAVMAVTGPDTAHPLGFTQESAVDRLLAATQTAIDWSASCYEPLLLEKLGRPQSWPTPTS